MKKKLIITTALGLYIGAVVALKVVNDHKDAEIQSWKDYAFRLAGEKREAMALTDKAIKEATACLTSTTAMINE